MYDTLVNLQSGPRLLGQELSMRPMTRDGALFDTLYLSSFGFGGDPNDMARLRMEKSKWYNFVGSLPARPELLQLRSVRQSADAEPWHYQLQHRRWWRRQSLARRCSTRQANYFYTNSPHLQDTTRNMGDFNLTLFPAVGYQRPLGLCGATTTMEPLIPAWKMSTSI